MLWNTRDWARSREQACCSHQSGCFTEAKRKFGQPESELNKDSLIESLQYFLRAPHLRLRWLFKIRKYYPKPGLLKLERAFKNPLKVVKMQILVQYVWVEPKYLISNQQSELGGYKWDFYYAIWHFWWIAKKRSLVWQQNHSWNWIFLHSNLIFKSY